MNAPLSPAAVAAGQMADLLAQALQRPPDAPQRQARVDIGARGANGLAQLVLAVIKLLHELLERQALRRIEAGHLNEDEIEALGLTLMRQAEEIGRLCEQFGLSPEDLNLDLGPLGKLL